MHMLMMTTLGLVLLAAFWFIGRLLNRRAGRAVINAPRVFLLVWATASFYNGYVGVTKAGYSVQAELLVHMVVFGLPAAIAVWLMWKKL